MTTTAAFEMAVGGIGRDPVQQRAQLLERVGLQQPEARVQAAGFQPRLRCSATTLVAIPPRTLKRAVSRR